MGLKPPKPATEPFRLTRGRFLKISETRSRRNPTSTVGRLPKSPLPLGPPPCRRPSACQKVVVQNAVLSRFSALWAQKSCIWPRSPFEQCSQHEGFQGSRSPKHVNMQSKWPSHSGRAQKFVSEFQQNAVQNHSVSTRFWRLWAQKGCIWLRFSCENSSQTEGFPWSRLPKYVFYGVFCTVETESKTSTT